MTVPVLLTVLWAVLSPASALDALLQHVRPDSLMAPLRALESGGTPGAEAGEAAYTLGQLHYARGEYRQSAAAYARAAARLDGPARSRARYWAGLAWLGADDATQARAALEEVARTDPALRALARLGVAMAWEAADRPENALDELSRLVTDAPGEAAPAALAHLDAVATRLRRDDVAKRARERLLREWPSSLEAVRVRSQAGVAPAVSGALSVQIGAFSDAGRARALVDAAHRAGFSGATVTVRKEGAARVHLVRIGDFPNPEEARRAGEHAAQVLGVAYQLVAP
jgi:tetratricopeptide (TPR) repeat protein